MLLKRFHDDNESIVAPKRFHIYKNRENIGKCWSMDLEWNGTGGFWKHQSRESIRVWKTVGNAGNVRVWNRKTSEYGKHQSMENIGKCQRHQSME